jgi:hypothetical protein
VRRQQPHASPQHPHLLVVLVVLVVLDVIGVVGVVGVVAGGSTTRKIDGGGCGGGAMTANGVALSEAGFSHLLFKVYRLRFSFKALGLKAYGLYFQHKGPRFRV